MPTRIMICNCESSFQDKTYGIGMRLHNDGAGITPNHATCTVCGKQKQLKKSEKPVSE